MTREIIENYRFILIPYMVNRFKEINYEGQGDSDAKEFMNDFNELCDLALKALEQEPIECNTVSEEVYTQEYLARKDADFQLYKLKKAIEDIRKEISEYGSIMVSYAITKDTKTDKGIEKLVSNVLKEAKEQVLEIIDKYKAEVESHESED